MSYLGLNSVQSFRFSPENQYSQEYNNACRKFSEAKYKMENSETVSAEKLETLADRLDYWEKKIPQIAMKAKAEEIKLHSQQGNEQNNGLGNKINFLA